MGQHCGPYGRSPCVEKVNAISKLGDCTSVSEVRRFLGACIFYRIWIIHFAHVADPLYELLRKGRRFEWSWRQVEAMKKLKEALMSPPVLCPLDYTCGRCIIITVDSSPIAAGWAVGQDDEEGRRFATRFGAKIFADRQRRYPQHKRELWGAKLALQQEKDYLIGAHAILETDCLPLLGLIANCTTPDIAMLRWIAFIRMINPELKHIAGKDNPVADMLSRARYKDEENYKIPDEGKAEGEMEGDVGCCISSHNAMKELEKLHFQEDLYSGELLVLGKYLQTLEKEEAWTKEIFEKIRKKAYGYMLRDGLLWRKPKKMGRLPQRVVGDESAKLKILHECHDDAAAGHRGVQATYEKVRELYWWQNFYLEIREYVESCQVCQYYSKVKHRDELCPTYPLSLHFQWSIDIVYMPRGLRGLRFLVLAREELSSYLEGRALKSNKAKEICQFVFEDIISRHGCFDRLREIGGS